ncbi:GNAT family N-acetyltransferase [Patescibacteria group bacterium]|nr:GNAT family N-acetyltransferase [Patescibacteria group bacterium]
MLFVTHRDGPVVQAYLNGATKGEIRTLLRHGLKEVGIQQDDLVTLRGMTVSEFTNQLYESVDQWFGDLRQNPTAASEVIPSRTSAIMGAVLPRETALFIAQSYEQYLADREAINDLLKSAITERSEALQKERENELVSAIEKYAETNIGNISDLMAMLHAVGQREDLNRVLTRAILQSTLPFIDPMTEIANEWVIGIAAPLGENVVSLVESSGHIRQLVTVWQLQRLAKEAIADPELRDLIIEGSRDEAVHNRIVLLLTENSVSHEEFIRAGIDENEWAAAIIEDARRAYQVERVRYMAAEDRLLQEMQRSFNAQQEAAETARTQEALRLYEEARRVELRSLSQRQRKQRIAEAAATVSPLLDTINQVIARTNIFPINRQLRQSVINAKRQLSNIGIRVESENTPEAFLVALRQALDERPLDKRAQSLSRIEAVTQILLAFAESLQTWTTKQTQELAVLLLDEAEAQQRALVTAAQTRRVQIDAVINAIEAESRQEQSQLEIEAAYDRGMAVISEVARLLDQENIKDREMYVQGMEAIAQIAALQLQQELEVAFDQGMAAIAVIAQAQMDEETKIAFNRGMAAIAKVVRQQKKLNENEARAFNRGMEAIAEVATRQDHAEFQELTARGMAAIAVIAQAQQAQNEFEAAQFNRGMEAISEMAGLVQDQEIREVFDQGMAAIAVIAQAQMDEETKIAFNRGMAAIAEVAQAQQDEALAKLLGQEQRNAAMQAKIIAVIGLAVTDEQDIAAAYRQGLNEKALRQKIKGLLHAQKLTDRNLRESGSGATIASLTEEILLVLDEIYRLHRDVVLTNPVEDAAPLLVQQAEDQVYDAISVSPEGAANIALALSLAASELDSQEHRDAVVQFAKDIEARVLLDGIKAGVLLDEKVGNAYISNSDDLTVWSLIIEAIETRLGAEAEAVLADAGTTLHDIGKEVFDNMEAKYRESRAAYKKNQDKLWRLTVFNAPRSAVLDRFQTLTGITLPETVQLAPIDVVSFMARVNIDRTTIGRYRKNLERRILGDNNLRTVAISGNGIEAVSSAISEFIAENYPEYQGLGIVDGAWIQTAVRTLRKDTESDRLKYLRQQAAKRRQAQLDADIAAQQAAVTRSHEMRLQELRTMLSEIDTRGWKAFDTGNYTGISSILRQTLFRTDEYDPFEAPDINELDAIVRTLVTTAVQNGATDLLSWSVAENALLEDERFTRRFTSGQERLVALEIMRYMFAVHVREAVNSLKVRVAERVAQQAGLSGLVRAAVLPLRNAQWKLRVLQTNRDGVLFNRFVSAADVQKIAISSALTVSFDPRMSFVPGKEQVTVYLAGEQVTLLVDAERKIRLLSGELATISLRRVSAAGYEIVLQQGNEAAIHTPIRFPKPLTAYQSIQPQRVAWGSYVVAGIGLASIILGFLTFGSSVPLSLGVTMIGALLMTGTIPQPTLYSFIHPAEWAELPEIAGYTNQYVEQPEQVAELTDQSEITGETVQDSVGAEVVAVEPEVEDESVTTEVSSVQAQKEQKIALIRSSAVAFGTTISALGQEYSGIEFSKVEVEEIASVAQDIATLAEADELNVNLLTQRINTFIATPLGQRVIQVAQQRGEATSVRQANYTAMNSSLSAMTSEISEHYFGSSSDSTVGVTVINLATGETFGASSQTVTPMESNLNPVKVMLLISLLQQEQGLTGNELLSYTVDGVGGLTVQQIIESQLLQTQSNERSISDRLERYLSDPARAEAVAQLLAEFNMTATDIKAGTSTTEDVARFWAFMHDEGIDDEVVSQSIAIALTTRNKEKVTSRPLYNQDNRGMVLPLIYYSRGFDPNNAESLAPMFGDPVTSLQSNAPYAVNMFSSSADQNSNRINVNNSGIIQLPNGEQYVIVMAIQGKISEPTNGFGYNWFDLEDETAHLANVVHTSFHPGMAALYQEKTDTSTAYFDAKGGVGWGKLNNVADTASRINGTILEPGQAVDIAELAWGYNGMGNNHIGYHGETGSGMCAIAATLGDSVDALNQPGVRVIEGTAHHDPMIHVPFMAGMYGNISNYSFSPGKSYTVVNETDKRLKIVYTSNFFTLNEASPNTVEMNDWFSENGYVLGQNSPNDPHNGDAPNALEVLGEDSFTVTAWILEIDENGEPIADAPANAAYFAAIKGEQVADVNAIPSIQAINTAIDELANLNNQLAETPDTTESVSRSPVEQQPIREAPAEANPRAYPQIANFNTGAPESYLPEDIARVSENAEALTTISVSTAGTNENASLTQGILSNLRQSSIIYTTPLGERVVEYQGSYYNADTGSFISDDPSEVYVQVSDVAMFGYSLVNPNGSANPVIREGDLQSSEWIGLIRTIDTELYVIGQKEGKDFSRENIIKIFKTGTTQEKVDALNAVHTALAVVNPYAQDNLDDVYRKRSSYNLIDLIASGTCAEQATLAQIYLSTLQVPAITTESITTGFSTSKNTEVSYPHAFVVVDIDGIRYAVEFSNAPYVSLTDTEKDVSVLEQKYPGQPMVSREYVLRNKNTDGKRPYRVITTPLDVYINDIYLANKEAGGVVDLEMDTFQMGVGRLFVPISEINSVGLENYERYLDYAQNPAAWRFMLEQVWKKDAAGVRSGAEQVSEFVQTLNAKNLGPAFGKAWKQTSASLTAAGSRILQRIGGIGIRVRPLPRIQVTDSIGTNGREVSTSVRFDKRAQDAVVADLRQAYQTELEFIASVEDARAKNADIATNTLVNAVIAEAKTVLSSPTKEGMDELVLHTVVAFERLLSEKKQITSFTDAQLIAIRKALHSEALAIELPTGTGKTYATACVALIRALVGQPVLVSSANADLAQRDLADVSVLFRPFRVSSGFAGKGKYLNPSINITYGKLSDIVAASGRALRVGIDIDIHAYTLLPDEGDKSLLQEALTPIVEVEAEQEEAVAITPVEEQLIISLARNTAQLIAEVGYVIPDEKQTTLSLFTPEANDKLDAYKPDEMTDEQFATYKEFARRAAFMQEGKDYLYDQYTGEITLLDNEQLADLDKKFQSGIQWALEAKHGRTTGFSVINDEVRDKHTTMAFVRQVGSVIVFTGTAFDEIAELEAYYNLEYVAIPQPLLISIARQPAGADTLRLVEYYDEASGLWLNAVIENQQGRWVIIEKDRVDYEPRLFVTEDAKVRAIQADVETLRNSGRAVLIASQNEANMDNLTRIIPNAISISERERDEKRQNIELSGHPGTVAVGSANIGRGVNFQPDEQVQQAGGFFEMIAGLMKPSTLSQVRGRVARLAPGKQGARAWGATRQYLSLADVAAILGTGDERVRELSFPSGEIVKSDPRYPKMVALIREAELKIQEREKVARSAQFYADHITDQIGQVRRPLSLSGFGAARQTVDWVLRHVAREKNGALKKSYLHSVGEAWKQYLVELEVLKTTVWAGAQSEKIDPELYYQRESSALLRNMIAVLADIIPASVLTPSIPILSDDMCTGSASNCVIEAMITERAIDTIGASNITDAEKIQRLQAYQLATKDMPAHQLAVHRAYIAIAQARIDASRGTAARNEVDRALQLLNIRLTQAQLAEYDRQIIEQSKALLEQTRGVLPAGTSFMDRVRNWMPPQDVILRNPILAQFAKYFTLGSNLVDTGATSVQLPQSGVTITAVSRAEAEQYRRTLKTAYPRFLLETLPVGSDEQFFFVQNEAGQTVGFIVYRVSGSGIDVSTLIISPEYQNQTYGTQVLETLKQQFDVIALVPLPHYVPEGVTLDEAYDALIRFYERAGFTKQAVVENRFTVEKYVWRSEGSETQENAFPSPLPTQTLRNDATTVQSDEAGDELIAEIGGSPGIGFFASSMDFLVYQGQQAGSGTRFAVSMERQNGVPTGMWIMDAYPTDGQTVIIDGAQVKEGDAFYLFDGSVFHLGDHLYRVSVEDNIFRLYMEDPLPDVTQNGLVFQENKNTETIKLIVSSFFTREVIERAQKELPDASDVQALADHVYTLIIQSEAYRTSIGVQSEEDQQQASVVLRALLPGVIINYSDNFTGSVGVLQRVNREVQEFGRAGVETEVNTGIFLELAAMNAVIEVMADKIGLPGQALSTIVSVLSRLPDVVDFLSRRLFDSLHTTARGELRLPDETFALFGEGQVAELERVGASVQKVWSSIAMPLFTSRGYEVAARMDVKNLRGVNDVVGEGGYTALGDYLLRMFADRVFAALGPDYELVRVGGDEYMIFAKPGASTADVQEKINALLAETHMLYKTPASTIENRPIEVEFKTPDATLPIEERNRGSDWLTIMNEGSYTNDATIDSGGQYHPLLAYTTDYLKSIGVPLASRLDASQITGAYNFIKRMMAVLLFDDVLRDKARELQQEFRGRNDRVTVAVYEDAEDWMEASRVEFPAGFTIVRFDQPGILKMLNNLSSDAGDQMIIRQFEKIARYAFEKMGVTHIRVYRRANELYLAVDPSVNIDSKALQSAFKGYTTSAAGLFKELPVISQTPLVLVQTGIDRRGTAINTQSLNAAFGRLAGGIVERTKEEILEAYVREPNSISQRIIRLFRRGGQGSSEALADAIFIVNYLNPFDKRGIDRLRGIGATEVEIEALKKYYLQSGPGTGEVVDDDSAYAAILDILKRVNRESSWWYRAWQEVSRRFREANEAMSVMGIVSPGTRAMFNLFGGGVPPSNITSQAKAKQHEKIADFFVRGFRPGDTTLQGMLRHRLLAPRNRFILDFIADHLLDHYFQQDRIFIDARRVPQQNDPTLAEFQDTLINELHNKVQAPQTVWSSQALPFLQGLGGQVVEVFEVEPLPETGMPADMRRGIRDLELRSIASRPMFTDPNSPLVLVRLNDNRFAIVSMTPEDIRATQRIRQQLTELSTIVRRTPAHEPVRSAATHIGPLSMANVPLPKLPIHFYTFNEMREKGIQFAQGVSLSSPMVTKLLYVAATGHTFVGDGVEDPPDTVLTNPDRREKLRVQNDGYGQMMRLLESDELFAFNAEYIEYMSRVGAAMAADDVLDNTAALLENKYNRKDPDVKVKVFADRSSVVKAAREQYGENFTVVEVDVDETLRLVGGKYGYEQGDRLIQTLFTKLGDYIFTDLRLQNMLVYRESATKYYVVLNVHYPLDVTKMQDELFKKYNPHVVHDEEFFVMPIVSMSHIYIPQRYTAEQASEEFSEVQDTLEVYSEVKLRNAIREHFATEQPRHDREWEWLFAILRAGNIQEELRKFNASQDEIGAAIMAARITPNSDYQAVKDAIRGQSREDKGIESDMRAAERSNSSLWYQMGYEFRGIVPFPARVTLGVLETVFGTLPVRRGNRPGMEGQPTDLATAAQNFTAGNDPLHAFETYMSTWSMKRAEKRAVGVVLPVAISEEKSNESVGLRAMASHLAYGYVRDYTDPYPGVQRILADYDPNADQVRSRGNLARPVRVAFYEPVANPGIADAVLDFVARMLYINRHTGSWRTVEINPIEVGNYLTDYTAAVKANAPIEQQQVLFEAAVRRVETDLTRRFEQAPTYTQRPSNLVFAVANIEQSLAEVQGWFGKVGAAAVFTMNADREPMLVTDHLVLEGNPGLDLRDVLMRSMGDMVSDVRQSPQIVENKEQPHLTVRAEDLPRNVSFESVMTAVAFAMKRQGHPAIKTIVSTGSLSDRITVAAVSILQRLKPQTVRVAIEQAHSENGLLDRVADVYYYRVNKFFEAVITAFTENTPGLRNFTRILKAPMVTFIRRDYIGDPGMLTTILSDISFDKNVPTIAILQDKNTGQSRLILQGVQNDAVREQMLQDIFEELHAIEQKVERPWPAAKSSFRHIMDWIGWKGRQLRGQAVRLTSTSFETAVPQLKRPAYTVTAREQQTVYDTTTIPRAVISLTGSTITLSTDILTMTLEKDMTKPGGLTAGEILQLRGVVNNYERNKSKLANIPQNATGPSVLYLLMPEIFGNSQQSTNIISMQLFFEADGQVKVLQVRSDDSDTLSRTFKGSPGADDFTAKISIHPVGNSAYLYFDHGIRELISVEQYMSMVREIGESRTIEEANTHLQTMFQYWFPNVVSNARFLTVLSVPTLEQVRKIQNGGAFLLSDPEPVLLVESVQEFKNKPPEVRTQLVSIEVDANQSLIATWGYGVEFYRNGQKMPGYVAVLAVGDVISVGTSGYKYEVLIDDANRIVFAHTNPNEIHVLSDVEAPPQAMTNISRGVVVVDGNGADKSYLLELLWPVGKGEALEIRDPDAITEFPDDLEPYQHMVYAPQDLFPNASRPLQTRRLEQLAYGRTYEIRDAKGNAVGYFIRMSPSRTIVQFFSHIPDNGEEARIARSQYQSLPDQLLGDLEVAKQRIPSSPNSATVTTTRRVGSMVYATGVLPIPAGSARVIGVNGTPMTWSVKLTHQDQAYYDSLSVNERIVWMMRMIEESDEVVYAQHGFQADSRVFAKPMEAMLLPYDANTRRMVGIAPALAGANGTYVETGREFTMDDAVTQSYDLYTTLDAMYDFSMKRVTFVGQSTGARLVILLAARLSDANRLQTNIRFELVAPYLLDRTQLIIFNGFWGRLYGHVNDDQVPLWWRRTLLFLAKYTGVDRIIVNNRLSGLVRDPAIADDSIVHRQMQQDIPYTTRWTNLVQNAQKLDWERLPEKVRVADIRIHIPREENIVDHNKTLEYLEQHGLTTKRVPTYGKGHYPPLSAWAQVGRYLNFGEQPAVEAEVDSGISVSVYAFDQSFVWFMKMMDRVEDWMKRQEFVSGMRSYVNRMYRQAVHRLLPSKIIEQRATNGLTPDQAITTLSDSLGIDKQKLITITQQIGLDVEKAHPVVVQATLLRILSQRQFFRDPEIVFSDTYTPPIGTLTSRMSDIAQFEMSITDKTIVVRELLALLQSIFDGVTPQTVGAREDIGIILIQSILRIRNTKETRNAITEMIQSSRFSDIKRETLNDMLHVRYKKEVIVSYLPRLSDEEKAKMVENFSDEAYRNALASLTVEELRSVDERVRGGGFIGSIGVERSKKIFGVWRLHFLPFGSLHNVDYNQQTISLGVIDVGRLIQEVLSMPWFSRPRRFIGTTNLQMAIFAIQTLQFRLDDLLVVNTPQGVLYDVDALMYISNHPDLYPDARLVNISISTGQLLRAWRDSRVQRYLARAERNERASRMTAIMAETVGVDAEITWQATRVAIDEQQTENDQQEQVQENRPTSLPTPPLNQLPRVRIDQLTAETQDQDVVTAGKTREALEQPQARGTKSKGEVLSKAIIDTFTNPDCYAMRSEYAVFAAETTRDGTCPTWGRSPRRVVRGIRNRNEREQMDADARRYVRTLILSVPPLGFLVDGALKAGIWYITAPPPPPVVSQCTLGSCAENGLCPAGQQCSATGCCTQLPSYEDFVCSVDGQYLLKRTMMAPGGFSIDVNQSFRCLDGCVNNDCAQKAQMVFPEVCTEEMRRTPMLYGFDSNAGVMNSCLVIDEQATMSYYREFTCSADGSSVVERSTGNVVRTCLGNQTCKQSGDIADCLGPVGYVRPQNAVIDMVCQGNDVYLFDSDKQTAIQHVASCPVHGCQQGACIAYEGERCDRYAVAGALDINAHVSVDGMPISCNAEGNVTITDGLNKRADVITGVNNIKNQVYDALALLPPGFLKKDFEIVVYPSGILYGDDPSWQSFWQLLRGSGRDNIGGVDNSTFPYHRRILLTEQEPELMTYAVVHEVMHAYAVDQLTIPVFVPLAGFYNMFSVGQHTNTPVGFHSMIGCKPDGTYDGVPFSDYENPDCAEEFAEEGAGYVFKACELKAYNEDRYNYFKNEVFEGREYLPPQGCVN